MRLWPWYLCWMFRHGRLEYLSAETARCARCGYVGGVDSVTGRLFWS